MRHRLPDRTRIRVLVRIRPYQPLMLGQLHPEAVRGGSACQNVRKAHAMQGGGGPSPSDMQNPFPIRLPSASSCLMRHTAAHSPSLAATYRQVAGIILPEGNDKFAKFRRGACAGKTEQLAICALFRQWRASPRGIEESRRGACMVLRQRSAGKGKNYGSL